MAGESGEMGVFPFKEQPGEEIARGVEFRVLRHNDGWVVKEGIHPKANTFEQLEQDKKDFDVFSDYVGQFLPETHHIQGHGSDGKPCNIVRQREIKGKPLAELSDEEVFGNSEVRSQLREFFEQCGKMWDEIGRVPDICGPEGDKIHGFNPRYARNILVEDGTNRVWLVDTAAHPLVFSKKAMLRYKPALFVLRKMMGRFQKKLRPDEKSS